jgi:hypothetical protein
VRIGAAAHKLARFPYLSAGRAPIVAQRSPIQFRAPQGEAAMAKGQQRGNREAKKPKKEKPKVIAAESSPFANAMKASLGKSGKKR